VEHATQHQNIGVRQLVTKEISWMKPSLIGANERRPTLLFNGYAEYVASIYKGLENERLWA
jgi:hypothetical protein